MPRVPTALLRTARTIDPFLPALLAPCRDLHTAQNELRWLREHVEKVAKARRAKGDTLAKGALLGQLVRERAKGKPLQYILGTEYVGDLEIKCRPGVLIPRQDTAASVTHLAKLVRDAHNLPAELRVLDLCTGTGCIPLLFRHEFAAKRKDVDLRIVGFDVSKKSVGLARENLRKNEESTQARHGMTNFARADVLLDPFADLIPGAPLPLRNVLNYRRWSQFWDILISNPPYISPSAYWKTTTRSVRGFEPRLALVPPPKAKLDDMQQGDMFYPRLLAFAKELEAKIVLLEVSDLEQALRVARLAQKKDIFDGVEIWRDEPETNPDQPTTEDGFNVYGTGNARSVVCWRGAGGSWLGKPTAPKLSQLNAGAPAAVVRESLLPSFKFDKRVLTQGEPRADPGYLMAPSRISLRPGFEDPLTTTFKVHTCILALAESQGHTTLALDELPQELHAAQKPFAAADVVSPYAFAGSQPMQAASEAGSAERPVGKMVVAVLVSGVLFGLGMGM
ncbi:HemK family methyltransferase [Stagonosporopsis vannaccii]|nr:HemK family methyltransferase [Stagonosporopsis vannaccii]